ncbi:hypothetical protein OZ664_20045 [Elizabethkingia sp. HX WHF]|uniref:hypothetical protein n=1 Tax=Elizabethkingia TaxID=308865 RepID=UPI000CE9ABAE|nr:MULTISPECIES: hypothetical protein [Elizabethkingia]AVF49401.1 hypothetical protein AL491_15520 [Elizabethkingia anophelis]AVF53396.1 hypothetical protein AL492_17925 [Elizabethkingia anophelis]MDV2458011.1 hypothetical protein [Elizabethkingia anophelis]MDX8566311.1 hypothetical protein [Elizabethkingia sp. HX WHF]
MEKSEKESALTAQFSRYLTGWAMSKAILDDYCEVISKLENISPEIVRERIMAKTQGYFDQAKEEAKESFSNSQ